MAKLIKLAGSKGLGNEGKSRVVARLLEQLPDDYWILPDAEILDDDGQIFAYDIIVLAPHALYILEVRDWSGEIRIDNREWLIDTKTRKSPLSSAEYKAKILRSKLAARAPALGRIWAEGAVVFSSRPSIPGSTDRVFLLEQLVHFLTDSTRVRQQPRAIADLGDIIRRTLGELLHA